MGFTKSSPPIHLCFWLILEMETIQLLATPCHVVEKTTNRNVSKLSTLFDTSELGTEILGNMSWNIPLNLILIGEFLSVTAQKNRPGR